MNFRKIATLAIAALVLVACGKSSGARGTGKITVTNIEKDGRNYTVTLNGVITIRNVQIKSGRGGQFLAFPQRKGSGGKFFNYVKVERADGDYLLNQVKNEETAASPTGFEITGVKVKPIESTGRTKAFVEFELNGVLTLYSWSIIEGDRGPFLGSPRDKVGDEWKDLVFATREFREQLQTAALAEYGRAGGTAPQPTSTRTPAATDDDEEEDDE